MNVNPRTAAIAIAAALVVGYVLPLPGGGSAPVAVHALDVAAESLAGPCDGMPELNAETLGWLFAPALVPDGTGVEKSPVILYIDDDKTFTIVPPVTGDYTVTLDDSGGASVVGTDPASAALLQRHMNICLGAVTTTPQDAPGVWTTAGTYVPMGAVTASDS